MIVEIPRSCGVTAMTTYRNICACAVSGKLLSATKFDEARRPDAGPVGDPDPSADPNQVAHLAQYSPCAGGRRGSAAMSSGGP